MTADTYQPNPAMRFGLVLPSIGRGTSPESLEAAASACVRHGWTSVWVTDHGLVPRGPEEGEYGNVLEAMTTLTWVAARFAALTIGTSVIVPAIRDAPQLAKELATLDTLTGGRLIVGVGASDSHDDVEYANMGKSDRFARRGAYLDESVALWRHLWGGRTDPFNGEFHTLTDYVFQPLPPQGAGIPIWCGGRSQRAVRRTAELADGYHAAQTGPVQLRERLPKIVEATRVTGRPLPTVSVRARVKFDVEPGQVYSICGSRKEMTGQLLELAALGVDDLVLVLSSAEPGDVTALADRFEREVIAPYRDQVADYCAAASRTAGRTTGRVVSL
jgi:alkanesulfonate monooxygenase SsuD/methylene tetrahydromethanopterin reductase-like flavin-dependent oxidoreductase (luciferase family)